MVNIVHADIRMAICAILVVVVAVWVGLRMRVVKMKRSLVENVEENVCQFDSKIKGDENNHIHI